MQTARNYHKAKIRIQDKIEHRAVCTVEKSLRDKTSNRVAISWREITSLWKYESDRKGSLIKRFRARMNDRYRATTPREGVRDCCEYYICIEHARRRNKRRRTAVHACNVYDLSMTRISYTTRQRSFAPTQRPNDTRLVRTYFINYKGKRGLRVLVLDAV